MVKWMPRPLYNRPAGESRAMSYVTVYVLRAKEGREEALIALYAQGRRLFAQAQGYLSSELLCSAAAPGEFLALVVFEDEASAWATVEDNPAYRAWYKRLVIHSETGPTVAHYHTVQQGE